MGQRGSRSGGGCLRAKRNSKWTCIFALIERQSLQKTHTSQNHRILYTTAICDSVPVAPVAAACVRNVMVNGFPFFTWKSQTLWKREGTRDEAKAEDRRAKEVVHLYTHPTPDRPPPGGPVLVTTWIINIDQYQNSTSDQPLSFVQMNVKCTKR